MLKKKNKITFSVVHDKKEAYIPYRVVVRMLFLNVTIKRFQSKENAEALLEYLKDTHEYNPDSFRSINNKHPFKNGTDSKIPK